VNALQEAVRDDGEVGNHIRTLDTAVQDANAAFNKRQEVLRGVS
jgi:hypothetical protein